jgi:hypothetical protein
MARKYEGFEWFIKSLEYAAPVWHGPRNDLVHHIGHRLAPVWLGIESPEIVCREIVSEVDRMLNPAAERAANGGETVGAGVGKWKGGERI